MVGKDGDGDDTVLNSDDTVIRADDTVMRAEDTVIGRDRTSPVEASAQTQGQALTSPEPLALPAIVFVLRTVTGQRYGVDGAVVMGRSPRQARLSRHDAVHLVTVPSPQGLVSATHVEFRQVGDVVVVTDLRSTHGTTVTLASGARLRLGSGDSFSVGEGAVVDIGDGNRIDVLREKPRDASNTIAR